jgi:hypothetical protein
MHYFWGNKAQIWHINRLTQGTLDHSSPHCRALKLTSLTKNSISTVNGRQSNTIVYYKTSTHEYKSYYLMFQLNISIVGLLFELRTAKNVTDSKSGDLHPLPTCLGLQ